MGGGSPEPGDWYACAARLVTAQRAHSNLCCTMGSLIRRLGTPPRLLDDPLEYLQSHCPLPSPARPVAALYAHYRMCDDTMRVLTERCSSRARAPSSGSLGRPSSPASSPFRVTRESRQPNRQHARSGRYVVVQTLARFENIPACLDAVDADVLQTSQCLFKLGLWRTIPASRFHTTCTESKSAVPNVCRARVLAMRWVA